MPGSMPPLDLSRQVADMMKRIQRLERSTASGGFDPNADPVVIGEFAADDAFFGVAIGYQAKVHADHATSIGYRSWCGSTADSGVCIGNDGTVDGQQGVCIGANLVSGFAGVAIGFAAQSTKDYQITLGAASHFVEIPGLGLVLTDTVTGTRYLIQITSGALVLNSAP